MNRRILIVMSCIGVLILALSGTVSPQSNDSGNLKTSIGPVYSIASGAVVPAAGASLSRSNGGVFGTISSSGLTPGHVVTFWWVIYNNPEFCANTSCVPPDLNNPAVDGTLQYGGGTVADLGGRVHFSGYLAVGDNTGFYLNPAFPNMPNPSPGIVSAKKAQIHLALRSHGFPNADAAILQQQLTSFPGGCSVAVPACATLQFSPFFP
ncbi:MAG TPA: hypothetical protein VJ306_10620 [Pyrinomonadaceae bacterium]|nr:hypothetical protein [Pyrinomonadaceae bacterium]